MYGDDATICDQTAGLWEIRKDLLNFSLPRGWIGWAGIQISSGCRFGTTWDIVNTPPHLVRSSGLHEPASCRTATP